MVEALASFFRYSISRKGNLVTLRDELNNIDNYMMIQRYRFNNRFSLEIIIDEEDESAYDILIPKLIVQPVVENAIFHGLEEKTEGGKITIEVILTEQNLILTISDNGVGMSPQQLNKLNEKIHSGDAGQEETKGNYRNTGIALPNIHKRIQLLYGEEYGVNIYSTEGMGTDVELTIPISRERRGSEE
jgi:two-component system sensor histidine kinase YesM